MAETSPDRPRNRAGDRSWDRPRDGQAEPVESVLGVHRPRTRTLVVGLTATENAWRAVAYAVGLASADARACRLVFVTATPTLDRFAQCSEVVPLARSAQAHVVGRLRADLDAMLAKAGIDWELQTVTGQPYRSVARVAEALHADAVVVGRSRRVRLLSRSIAVRLAKHARCPVVVVP